MAAKNSTSSRSGCWPVSLRPQRVAETAADNRAFDQATRCRRLSLASERVEAPPAPGPTGLPDRSRIITPFPSTARTNEGTRLALGSIDLPTIDKDSRAKPQSSVSGLLGRPKFAELDPVVYGTAKHRVRRADFGWRGCRSSATSNGSAPVRLTGTFIQVAATSGLPADDVRGWLPVTSATR